MIKHSPLPWKANGPTWIVDAEGLTIAGVQGNNIPFIVLACNNFDEMRGLLDAYTRALPDERELAPLDICTNGLLAKLEAADE